MKYQRGGILPSEMLFFVTTCIWQGVDLVIESGRKNGYSTEVLANYADCFNTTSFELSPIPEADARLQAKYPQLCLAQADGLDAVPQAAKLSSAHRIALLIDGPKGRLALRLVNDVHHRIAFAGVHDLHKIREGGTPNPARQDVDQHGWPCFFVEGLAIEERFSSLDRSAWLSFYTSRSEMTRHGFTLGLFPGGQWLGDKSDFNRNRR